MSTPPNRRLVFLLNAGHRRVQRWIEGRMAAEGGLTAAQSGVLFFLISNTGAWCLPLNGQYLYPQTLSGYWQCLVNGLPFARGTLAGDILLTPVLFHVANLVLAGQAQVAEVGSENAAS